LGNSIRRAGWRPSKEQIRDLIESYAQDTKAKAAPLLALLERDEEHTRRRLAQLEPLLDGGDVRRGRQVFFGDQVACSACHRVGAEGGQVGPDLTRIAAVRSGRDLLESIVVPASTFAQGYENYVIVTADGRVSTGMIAHQTDQIIVLRDSSGAEWRVSRQEVREMRRLSSSVMPEGLESKLPAESFRDLLAFLLSLK
jgi:quinoprotein glucose dehydrogenase